MPFIISISGAEKIGVSVACQRLYHALRHTHTVKIVDMKTRNNVMAFEDDLLTDEYKDFDVLIIDKHPYISSALHRNLRSSLFDDDSVKPDISFVMVCRFDTYKQRRPIHRHTGGLEKTSSRICVCITIHRHTGGLEINLTLMIICVFIHRHTGGLESFSESG